MNQILYSRKAQKSHTLLIVFIILTIIVLFFMFGFGLINLANSKILKGVSIVGVDVSNMTSGEALEAVKSSQSGEASKRLVLNCEEDAVVLNSVDVDYGYHFTDEIVNEAYSYGRDGNIIQNNFTVLRSLFGKKKEIASNKTVDEIKLKEIVEEELKDSDMLAQNDSYVVSGDKLILVKGTMGTKVDYEKLTIQVINAIQSGETYIDIPTIVSEPEKVDIDTIHSEVCCEPKNATYTTTGKFEIIKEENGLDFDKTLAKEKYSQLAYGESAEIELTVTEPEVKVSDLGDVLFNNLISTYTSKYDTSDADRVTNLKVAAERCNDTILYPGDEFSFNKALGHRTVANGFKMGNSFAGGKVVKTVGGGICQVSSSLYNAVLRADLTITARTAHGMYVQYVEQSTDATVVDNAIDFKFRNDRKYPVKIVTTCENGIVTASVYGYKSPDEYDIKIDVKILETIEYTTQTQNDSTMMKGTSEVVQKPVNGYVSESYKVYYKDGKEVSREFISKDKYYPTNEIIKVGTKEATVTPKPTPTPAPVEPEKPVVTPTPEPEKPILPPGWDSPESGY